MKRAEALFSVGDVCGELSRMTAAVARAMDLSTLLRDLESAQVIGDEMEVDSATVERWMRGLPVGAGELKMVVSEGRRSVAVHSSDAEVRVSLVHASHRTRPVLVALCLVRSESPYVCLAYGVSPREFVSMSDAERTMELIGECRHESDVDDIVAARMAPAEDVGEKLREMIRAARQRALAAARWTPGAEMPDTPAKGASGDARR